MPGWKNFSMEDNSDPIGKKLAEQSSKINTFLSPMIDERGREIGFYVEQCQQSDAKLDILIRTLYSEGLSISLFVSHHTCWLC